MINSSNYVCATTLDNLVLAKGAAGPVLDHSASMLAQIERRCGTDVAMLFAQPTVKSGPEQHRRVLVRGGRMASPRPLADFDEIGQRPFAEILRTRLARLLPIMADPAIGATVGAALNIRSFQDIYVVGRDVGHCQLGNAAARYRLIRHGARSALPQHPGLVCSKLVFQRRHSTSRTGALSPCGCEQASGSETRGTAEARDGAQAAAAAQVK